MNQERGRSPKRKALKVGFLGGGGRWEKGVTEKPVTFVPLDGVADL